MLGKDFILLFRMPYFSFTSVSGLCSALFPPSFKEVAHYISLICRQGLPVGCRGSWMWLYWGAYLMSMLFFQPCGHAVFRLRGSWETEGDI